MTTDPEETARESSRHDEPQWIDDRFWGQAVCSDSECPICALTAVLGTEYAEDQRSHDAVWKSLRSPES